MSQRRRSFMSQLRTGILPLELQTGRFTPIYDKKKTKNRQRTPNERTCKICDNNDIENEYNFIRVCPIYNGIRKQLVNSAKTKTIKFELLALENKFIY